MGLAEKMNKKSWLLQKANQGLSLLHDEKPIIYIFYARALLYSFFIWKLLSRDYRLFTFASDNVLNIYSVDTFTAFQNYTFMGRGWLVDLVTFHWVHWVLPLPNYQIMEIIYFSTIVLCAINVIVGRGKNNIFSIAAYCLLTYLWGFNWRTGADVDAVFIPLQAALVITLFRGADNPIWRKECFSLKPDREAGFLYSMMLIVFIGYYQLSGFNKLIDVSLYEWFAYDLFTQMIDHKYYALAGWHIAINPLPLQIASYFPAWLIDFSVVLVYFSHLTTFLMYFNRHLIAKFMYFYWVFHFVSTGLGIWFSGLLVFWLIFLPVWRFFETIDVFYDPSIPGDKALATAVRWLDFLNKIVLRERKGGFFIRYSDGNQVFQKNIAICRIAWLLPLMWFFLPLLYLPLVARGISKLFDALTTLSGKRYER